MAPAILVGLDVALIPGDPKWRFGDLDHKEIEFGLGWQALNRYFHDFDRADRRDSHVGGRVRETRLGPAETTMSK
jgi:hypothetical protein